MWQPSNQRRAHANGKKSDRARVKLPLHVNRVNARLDLNQSEAFPDANSPSQDVRVVLNDLTPKGVGIFCTAALTIGQEISLVIPSPLEITIQGKIIWCQEYSMNSHVLSAQSFSFRAGIEFVLKTEDEKLALENLCSEVSQDYVLLKDPA